MHVLLNYLVPVQTLLFRNIKASSPNLRITKVYGHELRRGTVEKPILLAGTHATADQRGDNFLRSPNGPTTGLHII